MTVTIGADVSPDFRDKVDERREEGESRSAVIERLLREALKEEQNHRSNMIFTYHISLLTAFVTILSGWYALLGLAGVAVVLAPTIWLSLSLSTLPVATIFTIIFFLQSPDKFDDLKKRTKGYTSRARGYIHR